MVGIANLEAIIADVKGLVESAQKLASGNILLQLPEVVRAYGKAMDAFSRLPAAKSEVMDLDLAESQRLLLEVIDLAVAAVAAAKSVVK